MRTNWRKIAEAMAEEIAKKQQDSNSCFGCPIKNCIMGKLQPCPTDKEIIEHYRQKIEDAE